MVTSRWQAALSAANGTQGGSPGQTNWNGSPLIASRFFLETIPSQLLVHYPQQADSFLLTVLFDGGCDGDTWFHNAGPILPPNASSLCIYAMKASRRTAFTHRGWLPDVASQLVQDPEPSTVHHPLSRPSISSTDTNKHHWL